MEKLLDYINKQTNNTYRYLKLVSVVYDKDSGVSTFRFIYENCLMTQANKDQLIALITKFYNNELKVDVKLKRSYLDDDVIREWVYKYLLENCAVLTNFNKKDIDVSISEKNVLITIVLVKEVYDYFNSIGMDKKIQTECDKNFFGVFKVLFSEIENETFEDILVKKEREINNMYFEEEKGTSNYSVEHYKHVLGPECKNDITPIKAIKGPVEHIEVGGKVHYMLKKTYMKKTKDNEVGEEKPFYKFALKYDDATINCTYFPTKIDGDKIEDEVQDGDEIIAVGSVESYNGNISLRVRGISQCVLPKIEVKEVGQKECPKEYVFVKPEDYVNPVQANFLLEERPVNAFLAQNDVVVFDFETTGLDHQTCEIIEIGAVKIKNGKLAEIFSTFVKPKSTISEEITSITSITNEMVKDAPSIAEVLPDFYKFCHDCVIVAYNIDFDYKFLNFAGTKLGYKFTNRQVDALYLARLNVKGAKTFNLKSIATRLGVSLDNAHRAINDAIATAEVLLLISDNVSPN